jgi:tripartite ATP-independent transporter DctP family solute receptor
MKKLVVALLLIAVVLTGAFAQGEKDKAKGVVELQIAHDNHPGDPLTVACEYWAEILNERSGGTMTLKTYPSGQLGSKNDLIDQMYAGDPIMVVVNGPYAADRGVADMGITQAPYLFTSWDQLRKLMDSPWGDEQKAQLRKIGMQVVADNWQYGARHTLTVKPVRSPADLRGMKVRTQGSTIHVEGFRVLGANPTPMTLSEVYTSLQQGVIEGLENPISVLHSGKFHEVAKNLMLDGHILDLSFIVIGTGVFDKLTAEQQQLLVETGLEAGRKQNELADAADKRLLEQMVAEGVVINDINIKEFQDAAVSFYSNPAINRDWSPNLLETVQKIINN